MKKVVLSIEGMTCSACSNGLEKYLNKQNGIINATVNLVMANATIDYDDNNEIHIKSILYGQSHTISKGEKFAQLVLAEVPKVSWLQVDSVLKIGEDRGGGFGSTGLK